jgi:dephospho-CoA kinase
VNADPSPTQSDAGKTRPALIGITGGIGSGKSTACRILAERYPVLSSDTIARYIMEHDDGIRTRLRAEFGDAVFNPDGQLHRSVLADLVFRDPAKLARLNAIVHPATAARVSSEAFALFASGGHRIVFVESALIYEAGIEERFDAVIVIAAKEQTILERLRAAGSFTHEDWQRRSLQQLPVAEKISRADFTIHNDGAESELRSRLLFILSIITSMYG